MVRRVEKDIKRNIHGIRKRKDHTIKMRNLEATKKKAVTRSHLMTRQIITVNITRAERRRRKENTDIKNIIRRDQKLPDITKKPTKTNTIKNINSMMINMKMENIRNMETNMNIIMKKKENIR
jgi:hypothetical protein